MMLRTRILWCDTCEGWVKAVALAQDISLGKRICPICGQPPRVLRWGIDEFTREQLKTMAQPFLGE